MCECMRISVVFGLELDFALRMVHRPHRPQHGPRPLWRYAARTDLPRLGHRSHVECLGKSMVSASWHGENHKRTKSQRWINANYSEWRFFLHTRQWYSQADFHKHEMIWSLTRGTWWDAALTYPQYLKIRDELWSSSDKGLNHYRRDTKKDDRGDSLMEGGGACSHDQYVMPCLH